MMSSNGNVFHITGPLWGEFTGDRWIPLTKASDTELWWVFFICAWTNGWANNRDAGDLRCHNVYYNVFPIESSSGPRGWVGLWGFLWWAPSAKRKDHHGVSSGWSSVWHRSNTGLSSTQYEQIPIILGVWPFWLTALFFWSITDMPLLRVHTEISVFYTPSLCCLRILNYLRILLISLKKY